MTDSIPDAQAAVPLVASRARAPCAHASRLVDRRLRRGGLVVTDSTDAERRDWLQGYEFALRNLSDEAVQADLARVRAESDTHGSDGQSGQPRAVRESGATTTVAQQECPEGGNHVPMSDDTCGVSCRYCRTPMPEVAGITTEPARSVRRD